MATITYTPKRDLTVNGGTITTDLQVYDRLPKTKLVEHIPLGGGQGETVFHNREILFNCKSIYFKYDQIDLWREWAGSVAAKETFEFDPYDNATTPGTYQMVPNSYKEERFGNAYYAVTWAMKELVAPVDSTFPLGGGGGGGGACIGYSTALDAINNALNNTYGAEVFIESEDVCAGLFIAYQFITSEVSNGNGYTAFIDQGSNLNIYIYQNQSGVPTLQSTNLGLSAGSNAASDTFSGLEDDQAWIVIENPEVSIQTIRVADQLP